MPTVALESLSLSSARMTVYPNAARILEVEHCIPWGSPDALDIGQVVSYTDADMGVGRVFHGEIVSRQKRITPSGEGYQYQCADAYNELAMTACTIVAPGNSAKTGVVSVLRDSLISAALTKVLACVSTKIPGGVSLAADYSTAKVKTNMDRGGAWVSDWVDDILRQAENAVSYIEPNGGSPRLRVVKFDAQPEITLTVGSYGTINLDSGTIVMAEANCGETRIGKYRRVRAEGSGIFQRVHDHVVVGIKGQSLGNGTSMWKFSLGSTRPSGRMVDGETCKDEMIAKITVGSVTMTIMNPPIRKEGNGWYFTFPLADYSVGPTAKFTYTKYIGPLVLEAESLESKLKGELHEIHDQFFKYTDPNDSGNNVDHTVKLQEIADARLAQVGTLDWKGSTRLFIKGLNSAVVIGARIANFGSGSVKPRVQSITYDFVERTMVCELKAPAFDPVKNQRKVNLGLLNGNWGANKLSKNAPDSNCFSGWKESDGDTEVTDNLNGPVVDGTGGSGPWGSYNRYACINGACVEGTQGGAYERLVDCQRDCGAGQTKGGWFCLSTDDNVCEQIGSSGGYQSAAECQAACNNGSGLVDRWINDGTGCRQVKADSSTGYASQQDCETATGGDKSHACQYAVSSVNTRNGLVTGVGCFNPTTKKVVTNATCSNGNINLTTENIKVFG